MTENELSGIIIGAAIEVHRELGPGLLARVYEVCLAHELKKHGLRVRSQVDMQVNYKEIELDTGFKADLLINEKLIIEVKSVKELNDIHLAQLLTYLKLSDLRLGLLINFNTRRVREGIKRVVNGYI